MNYSTFPEQVDTFVRKYHLQAQDIPKMKEWKTLKEKINRTPEEETRLNQLTEDLRYAFIDPEEWNKFQDALVNTQQFFLDEVYVYIQQKQAEFDAELEKFNHKGEYNPTRQYYKRNTVTFQGETYLCLKDCIGIAPDPFQDTEYWAKIAQRGAKGEKGDSGVGLRFRGQYNPNIYYQVDDAVQYHGNVFACLKENIGIEPNLYQDTEYWALAIAKGASTGTVEFKRTYVLTEKASNIPIRISEYNHERDVLTVIKNTTVLTEGEHYVINPNGTSIDCIDGIWDGSEEPVLFEFKVLKNYLIQPIYFDGTMIEQGTVGLDKLNPEVIQEFINLNKINISTSPPEDPYDRMTWYEDLGDSMDLKQFL